MRSLSMALIRHERIITTVAKAKELRPFVEKLITLAKKGTLHARRLAASRLGPMADAEVKPSAKEDDADHRPVLVKLFAELGPRFANRPGGYTRIIKRLERRLGDAGHTAFIELLKEGEQKVRTRAPAAPRVDEEEEKEAPEEHPPQPHGETPAHEASAPEGSAPAATGEAAAKPPAAGQSGTPPENPPKP